MQLSLKFGIFHLNGEETITSFILLKLSHCSIEQYDNDDKPQDLSIIEVRQPCKAGGNSSLYLTIENCIIENMAFKALKGHLQAFLYMGTENCYSTVSVTNTTIRNNTGRTLVFTEHWWDGSYSRGNVNAVHLRNTSVYENNIDMLII